VRKVWMQRRADRQFAGFPTRFHHPQIVNAKTASESSEHQTHRGGALPLSFSGVDLEGALRKPRSFCAVSHIVMWSLRSKRAASKARGSFRLQFVNQKSHQQKNSSPGRANPPHPVQTPVDVRNPRSAT